MSFLRKLFYRPPSYKNYVSAIHHAADEMERTFRGMLADYNENITIGLLPAEGKNLVTPSSVNIFRARLFAASFWPTAYRLAYDSNEDSVEFIYLVAKTARKGSTLDKQSLGILGERFTIKIGPIIEDAFKAGPLVPGSTLVPEHSNLAEILHGLLADEIGSNSYTGKVRESVKIAVEANVAVLLNSPMSLFERADARNPLLSHPEHEHQPLRLLTLKCQYCGLSSKMPNDSLLILERGPTDDRGLDHSHLYCRRCHKISDLIGTNIFGLLLGKKFDHQQIIDPAYLIAQHPLLLNAFAPKIQSAMIQDGIVSPPN